MSETSSTKPPSVAPIELRTPRLWLRAWKPEDRAPFAELNRDPEVMEFFPAPLTRAESDGLVDRFSEHIQSHGYGRWAVESKDEPFIGFVGLSAPKFDAPFMPCIEIAWRLKRSAWGKGYASEAAREVLRFGFETLGLREIVSFTARINQRSWQVMERIGMQRDPAGDFEHPLVDPGHPLRPHVLYRTPNRLLHTP